MAKWGVLGADDDWWITVNVSCAHLNPNRRGMIEAPKGQSEHARGFDPRAEDLILMVRRFNAIHTPAGEVDQPRRPLEGSAPFPEATRIPAQGFPGEFASRWRSSKDHDRPPLAG